MSDARKVQIKFVISKNGEVKVEGSGFNGQACSPEIGKFLDLGTVTSDDKKPEYYNEQQNELEVSR